MIVAAIGFGTLGPLARSAQEVGFSAVGFASWRAIFSSLALAGMLGVGVALARVPVTPWSRISRLEWVQLAAMGVFVAGTTASLFLAFERTTIALALIVFYTFPVMVAMAAVPVYGERLGPRRATAMLVAGVGLLLLLAPAASGADGGPGLDAQGVLLAFIGALCQTGYALVAGRGFASVPALQAATALRAFSAACYVLVALPVLLLSGAADGLVEPLSDAASALLIIAAGFFGAALPTALLVAGYRRVGPTRGAVLMLVEPVVGVLLAASLLAETPVPPQLLGGLLVLAGAASVQVLPARRATSTAVPAAE